MDMQEYDDILRNLIRIAVHQDTINERLTTAIEHLDVTLQAIKNMLERGNGRP